ncbi:MerR family transcriptional regulator [Marinomonas sp. TW1]|uniref:MerR family transcriptional regulator n=1 Tax=Marinomonas sp. TW1 TaxID=1561203 RepID=UPI0007AF7289|nr:MerR family transcriptional regulator [Marinomonas sp. TW1]KZN14758.1 MerR family transcriptional regulator [Marinomonas sp. TW1]
MQVSEFSQLTGVSSHTLRYYEKIGLLKNVRRNASGHRDYAEKDLAWMAFIQRLKATGMSLDNIQRYSEYREQGDVSLVARKQLLEVHKSQLESYIQSQQSHLAALQDKINHYHQQIND